MTKSEQARADAMADAETLRIYGHVHASNYGRRFMSRLIHRAGFLGGYVATVEVPRLIGAPGCGSGSCAEEGLRSTVRDAARAAFRAVPGLRA